MKCLEVFVLTAFFSSSFCDVHYDYYWRNYNGDIPVDAVPGGIDISNKTTYIGQVYYLDGGIFPATIYPGRTSVTIPVTNKIYEIKQSIKILCSTSLEKLKWIPATAADLHLQMVNKFPVRGGTQFGEFSLYVGRAWYKGELKVSKVFADIGGATMYAPDKWVSISFSSYEILVYEIAPPESR